MYLRKWLVIPNFYVFVMISRVLVHHTPTNYEYKIMDKSLTLNFLSSLRWIKMS